MPTEFDWLLNAEFIVVEERNKDTHRFEKLSHNEEYSH